MQIETQISRCTIKDNYGIHSNKVSKHTIIAILHNAFIIGICLTLGMMTYHCVSGGKSNKLQTVLLQSFLMIAVTVFAVLVS